MDQRFFAAPHGFSQLSTSFIAIACLGIHRTPLLTCPCMACTIAVRPMQAMSSIYVTSHSIILLIRASPEGACASFTIQHVKEHPPPSPKATEGRPSIKGSPLKTPGRPCPAQLNFRRVAVHPVSSLIYIITTKPSRLLSIASATESGATGATHAVATSKPLHHITGKLITTCALTPQNQNVWWSYGDSNPGPPACKAGALAN